MVYPCEQFGRHDVAFVAHASLPAVRFVAVLGGEHDEHKIVRADGVLHEMGELGTEVDLPSVELRVNGLFAESPGEFNHPLFMCLVVPRIGHEGSCGTWACRTRCEGRGNGNDLVRRYL